MGAKEIVLEMDLFETSLLDGEIRKSDISGIVTFGSDGDFTRLKHMLSSRCSWITETCAKLDGILKVIMDVQLSQLHLPLSPNYLIETQWT